ncbi:uncharacterized protein F4817DRAFT_335693 [Daldinia loculata]|uniref:uncharacterized protein n=1 Tax=Daldinia loculata TaxID=103429 RepID=UPI0020C4E9FD|nr:uncharacterized protein F4817DRAFT_335693 [Daldinia loculata]KAI1648044.1 hypothetical protein F4817DRAFT_335693 [Daldinia loculata]
MEVKTTYSPHSGFSWFSNIFLDISFRIAIFRTMTTLSIDSLEALSNKLCDQIQELRTASNNDILIRREAAAIAKRLMDELIDPEQLAAEQTVTVYIFMIVLYLLKIPNLMTT